MSRRPSYYDRRRYSSVDPSVYEPSEYGYGPNRRPSYRAPPSYPSYDRSPPDAMDFPKTLTVCIRVRLGRNGNVEFIIHSWSGKNSGTVIEQRCKRYIKNEMRKSLNHHKLKLGNTGRGVMRGRKEAAFAMEFRINKLFWVERSKSMEITEVQPDIDSFTSAKIRR